MVGDMDWAELQLLRMRSIRAGFKTLSGDLVRKQGIYKFWFLPYNLGLWS